MEITVQRQSLSGKNNQKRIYPAIAGILAMSVGAYALLVYGLGMPTGFMKMKQAMELSGIWKTMLVIHALAGGIALSTGWMQFFKKFRQKYSLWHRRLGMLFYAAAFTSAIAGLYVAFYASGGIPAKAGFVSLSLVWLVTLSAALLKIKRNDIYAHEKWAFRCYAITFAAVTLRIYTTIMAVIFGVDRFLDFYPMAAWMCWVPNLVIIEWYLRYKARSEEV